jgi:hypothetical protein
MRVSNPLKFSALIISVISGLAAPLAFAKTINLYADPNNTAKVVGTIESSNTMVPIFSDKTGIWMKVGDPKNGNVGWIKVSDVTNAKSNGGGVSGFSMTEQTIDTKDGPTTYRTIQFGNGAPAHPESAQAIIQKIQAQQTQIQQQTQKAYTNLYRDMNVLYQTNPAVFNNPGFPLFMPVIIVPPQSNAIAIPPTNPAKPVATPVSDTPAPVPKS